MCSASTGHLQLAPNDYREPDGEDKALCNKQYSVLPIEYGHGHEVQPIAASHLSAIVVQCNPIDDAPQREQRWCRYFRQVVKVYSILKKEEYRRWPRDDHLPRPSRHG